MECRHRQVHIQDIFKKLRVFICSPVFALVLFFFSWSGQCTSSPEDADGRNIQALQLAAAQGLHK